ncbi:MAG: hypothetical protein M3R16_00815 [Pseudomonadota bacterium]|nr:hypothetical protein [Pseudomonadota bacterium]
MKTQQIVAGVMVTEDIVDIADDAWNDVYDGVSHNHRAAMRAALEAAIPTAERRRIGAVVSGPVEVMAVMESAPSVTVAGVTVLHTTKPWRVAKNKHPTCSGQEWGWIEGPAGNVCWSDDQQFNRKAAEQIVAAHTAWLEEQKPISIRLVEVRERYAKAKTAHDIAHAAYLKAHVALCDAENAIAALAPFTTEQNQESEL